MPYTPIQDYGLIGNMRTAALVSKSGSIDWLCLPKFDSPSIFAAILDDKKGGHFLVRPLVSDEIYRQYYWPSTNILVTHFLHSNGIAEIQDYMPVIEEHKIADQIVRRVRAARGRMKFRMECKPAFNYARDQHTLKMHDDIAVFHSDRLTVSLCSTVALAASDNFAHAEFTLNEGESALFVLRLAENNRGLAPCPSLEEAEQRFRATTKYWRDWLSNCTYHGRWRETVERSALALKLLTFEPTGAIIAAPTTSLPEHLGGVRNWDYRYTWIRDASFTIYALLRIGFHEEAIAFMKWLMERLRDTKADGNGPLRILYTVDGNADVKEEELSHLDGYMGSKPVRIGNAASNQFQLDIYGELMDAVYLFNRFASPLGYEQWLQMRELVDWLCENWQRPDQGLWEVRSGRHQFVYSKFMSWVAMDRALRLAHKRSFPANLDRWVNTRNEIYDKVMNEGWNNDANTFTQSFGSSQLDASALLMPVVYFVAGNDPRMLSTLDAINRPVSQGGLMVNGMVYRYNTKDTNDGLPAGEGTFNMCSFWLVQALTRAGVLNADRAEQARLIFEHMVANANHLGLYSEQTGLSGDMLGNYPQALTHLSLVSAAFNLDRLLSQRERVVPEAAGSPFRAEA